MRVFVTGGAGFIGGRLVARLAERGDDVVVAVRDPSRRTGERAANVRFVGTDLSDEAALGEQIRGADAVVHAAGQYRVGIGDAERPAMWDANVGATKRVLDAAIAAGVPRIVHVSTVNAFGNTRGLIVDETFHRDPALGFLSFYDETKWRAHLEAEDRIARGAPVVIAMPGTTIGPGDHSQMGEQLRAAYEGTLRYRAGDDVGVAPAHVDDVAAGLVAALDSGGIGRSYVLCGRPVRLGEALEVAARLGGHRLPRLRLPNGLLRVVAALGRRVPPSVAATLGVPAGVDEIVRASAGVTYWATNARARAELGFAPRDLETALRDTFAG